MKQSNGIKTARIAWERELVTVRPDEVLNEGDALHDGRLDGAVLDEAKVFLQAVLKSEPVKAKDVLAEAREAGHFVITLRRAKKALGIVSKMVAPKGEKPYWLWQMSKGIHAPLTQNDDHLQQLQCFQGEKNANFEQEDHDSVLSTFQKNRPDKDTAKTLKKDEIFLDSRELDHEIRPRRVDPPRDPKRLRAVEDRRRQDAGSTRGPDYPRVVRSIPETRAAADLTPASD